VNTVASRSSPFRELATAIIIEPHGEHQRRALARTHSRCHEERLSLRGRCTSPIHERLLTRMRSHWPLRMLLQLRPPSCLKACIAHSLPGHTPCHHIEGTVAADGIKVRSATNGWLECAMFTLAALLLINQLVHALLTHLRPDCTPMCNPMHTTGRCRDCPIRGARTWPRPRWHTLRLILRHGWRCAWLRKEHARANPKKS
jgi:hypothetical protein